MSHRILLTGGAGFIGSHTYTELVSSGYTIDILDNFENSKRDVPDRLAQITNKTPGVVECDIRNRDAVADAFRATQYDAVVHFAAKKSVPDSDSDPVAYFDTNCGGLINVMSAMEETGVNALVFSSSAAVYGNATETPISETTALAPENTYAVTKMQGEQVLQRWQASRPGLRLGILRYFNPVGAHPSGKIGEDPNGVPSNLIPVIRQVALGQRDHLTVFGGDYPTHGRARLYSRA
jgi:UDP-glucose 4-epimerase